MWAITDDGYIFYKDNRTKPVKGNGKRDVQSILSAKDEVQKWKGFLLNF